MITDFSSSFYNGTFSDLTIIVNGEAIKAHKVIVDSQSNLLEPYVHQQRSKTVSDNQSYFYFL